MNWPSVILGLLLTVAAYLAFPLIKLYTNGERFEKEEARKIALWNSIICGVIFLVLSIASENVSAWNATPAIVYYFVNYAILAKKDSTETGRDDGSHKIEVKESLVPERDRSISAVESKIRDNINVAENEPVLQSSPSTEKVLFCRKCGTRLLDQSRFCHKCGERNHWD